MAYNPTVRNLYDYVITYKTPLRFLILEPGNITYLPDIINEATDLVEVSNRYPNSEPLDLAMLYFRLHSQYEIDDIKKEIDRFYKFKNLRLILNLEDEYKDWATKIEAELNNDTLYAIDFIRAYDTLYSMNVSSLLISPINYTFVNRITHPLWKVITEKGEILRVPLIDDGLDIFDFAIPSYDVPFIQYNKNINDMYDNVSDLDIGNRYKIFKGDTNNQIPLELIILGKSDTKDKDVLYLTVWTGKNINKLVKEYYVPVSYDLKTNTLEFSVPLKNIDTADLIISRLETCLGLVIDRDSINDLSVGAEFMIYKNIIDHHIFSYAILNDDTINTFFYIDERTKATSLKKVHRLRYKDILKRNDPLSSVAWLTFHNIESLNAELFPLVSETGDENIQLEAGVEYIKISIVKANNKDIADELYLLFSKLVIIYLQRLDTYKAELSSFYNENLFEEIVQETTIVAKKKRSERNVFTLKELGKGLIENHYARSCQCKRQPIIIKQEDIPEWSTKTFIYKGIVRPNQVMPFPPDNPKWWFVCIKDQYPFPGVRINKEYDIGKYPYVPCCFKRDQTISMTGTLYDHYYNKNPLKSKAKRNKDILASNKTLGTKRLGELPITVSKLLNKYDQNDDTGYYRYGMPISSNSLLHCIFEALEYSTYISEPNDEAKEKFVRNYRSVVFNPEYHIKTGVSYENIINSTKQELYDYSNSEVKELLRNPDIFLDPALFYRYIEEIFQINLYVFTTNKNNEDNFAILETPRHKLFHTRFNHKNRRSIVIFKYWLNDSSGSKAIHPQCELIVRCDKEDFDIIERSYDPNMSKLLHDIILKTKNTLTWSIDPNNMRVTARKNLYESINSYEILSKGNKVIAQFLDGYGKARGFVLLDGTVEVSVIVPPTQPENLPVYNQIRTKPNMKVVQDLFGNDVTFISLNSDGLVNGLWYKILDLEEGFYVPIQEVPRDLFKDIPIGPINPLFTDGKNLIKRIKELNKTNKIIIQIVQWLFLKSQLPLKDFIETYFKISGYNTPDSANIYDIRNVPRHFPILDNFTDCLIYIRNIMPSLIQNNKIILYSKKYTEGIIYYLKEYLRTREYESGMIPKTIKSILIEESDFKQFNNTVIFTNETDMRIWLYTKTHMGIKTSIIHKKIDFSDNNLIEPFLYQDSSGKFYIIQNVSNSDFKRAINVSYTWYVQKINLGYDADMYPERVYPRNVIYGITAGNIPEPIKDNREGEDKFLQLLNYGGTQYAAMLPL